MNSTDPPNVQEMEWDADKAAYFYYTKLKDLLITQLFNTLKI